MPLSVTCLSISSVSAISFLVSLFESFCLCPCHVKGLLGLLASPILVSVIDPGLKKGPLFLLLGLIRVSRFVGWSSVRFSVFLNTDVDSNRDFSLQRAGCTLSANSLCIERCSTKFESWSIRHLLIHLADESISLRPSARWTWLSRHGQMNKELSSLMCTRSSRSPV